MRKSVGLSLVFVVIASTPAVAGKSDRRAKVSPQVSTPVSDVSQSATSQLSTAGNAATVTGRNKGKSKSKSKIAVPGASPPILIVPGCGDSMSQFGTAASACAGFFSGNLLNSSPTDLDAQRAALAQLGMDFSGDFASYAKIDTENASFLDFGQQLFGNTIIGVHFGNGSGVGNSTAFFQFDFDSLVEGITLNIPASSGAVLYRTSAQAITPAPEPTTWAMMLLGFGLVGFSLRRKGNAGLMSQAA